jgi:sialic acid synthase SpsE
MMRRRSAAQQRSPSPSIESLVSQLTAEITLGSRRVGSAQPAYIVAELACAHEGDPDFALRWIEAAAEARADAVKFQAFTADGLVVPGHELHAAYKRFEFRVPQWERLAERARNLRLGVLVDVFEPYSLAVAEAIAADGLKVHSTNVTNPTFLERVAALGMPVIVGAGGTTRAELEAAVAVFRRHGRPIALMHGFQGYPTADADSHLRRAASLARDFDCPIGFAGHADGASDAAVWQNLVALGLGCSILENHLTLDRSPSRTDYHSSLLPDRFAQMVAAVRKMEIALGDGGYDLGPAEAKYRATFKAYIVSSRDLAQGHVLEADDLAFKRAAAGLLPSEAQKLLGRPLRRDLAQDTPITEQDVDAPSPQSPAPGPRS